MTCQESHGQLTACADGELNLDAARRMEEHLSTCIPCRDRFAAVRQLKHGIARLEAREEPPAAVRARIETAELEFRRAGDRFRAAVAAAILVVVAVAAIFGYVRQRRTDLTAALVADHYRSLPAVTPPHLVSSDPGAVEQYFEGRTQFAPYVPQIGGATLLGARLCSINGRKAELLFYDVDGSTVSLFVCPADAVADPRGCRSRSGTTICSGTRDGVAIHVVGSLPPDRMERLVLAATSFE